MKELISEILKKNLLRLGFSNVDKIIEDLLKFLKENQSLFVFIAA